MGETVHSSGSRRSGFMPRKGGSGPENSWTPDAQGIPSTTRWPTSWEAGRWVHESNEWLQSSGGRNIYHFVHAKSMLWWAWRRVRSKTGHNLAGVDRQTIRQIERDGVFDFLEEIRSDLKSGYEPLPTLRIPAGNRECHVRAVRDRVVELAVRAVLLPNFDFHPHAVAYRPGNRPSQVVEILARYGKSYEMGLRVDIANAFSEIRHVAVMAQVKKRIHDQEVLGLVRKFLRSGATPDPLGVGRSAKRISEVGIGQGTGLSTFLFEVAMRPVDDLYPLHATIPLFSAGVGKSATPSAGPASTRAARRTDPVPVHLRYGDDIVVLLHGGRAQGTLERDRLARTLEPMGLRLQPKKFQLVRLCDGFDMLGLNFRWSELEPCVTLSDARLAEWLDDFQAVLGDLERTSSMIKSKLNWLQMMRADVDDAKRRLIHGLKA